MAAKQQHYVPRFLLKNFARGEQLFVFMINLVTNDFAPTSRTLPLKRVFTIWRSMLVS